MLELFLMAQLQSSVVYTNETYQLFLRCLENKYSPTGEIDCPYEKFVGFWGEPVAITHRNPPHITCYLWSDGDKEITGCFFKNQVKHWGSKRFFNVNGN
ncbi:MAG: hypothetical protein ACKN9E_12670 [Microcystaceae cyanobacterium]